MSVFKLPEGVCETLERFIRDFWWGSKTGKRKVHWIAWEKLIKTKGTGGIGFKDFNFFNQAMLARQAWRLIVQPNTLCAKVLKAKYYPNGNLLDTVFPQIMSPTWRSIIRGLELVKRGVIWRIGSGEKVKIWRNNWLPKN